MEITIGDIFNALRGEISRLNPAEIVIPTGLPDSEFLSGIPITRWDDWHFELTRCEQTVLRHFGVASLDGYGMRGFPLAVTVSGVILQYLQDTQPAALTQLVSLKSYQLSQFMNMDAVTRRNLEITETIRTGDIDGSLRQRSHHTVSQMGKRQIRQWTSSPLLEIDVIQNRQKWVALFLENGLLRTEFRTALKTVIDIERVTNRISSGQVLPRELVALRSSLQKIPSIRDLFGLPDSLILELINKIHLDTNTVEILVNAISEEPPATLQNIGVIRPGYSPELDNTIEASRHAREWISNLEKIEKERTGIKTLKVGYNKIFGYYIEITHANVEFVPSEYIRKQTLVNAERYITPEMKEYEALILNSEDQIHILELRLFKEICRGNIQINTKIIILFQMPR